MTEPEQISELDQLRKQLSVISLEIDMVTPTINKMHEEKNNIAKQQTLLQQEFAAKMTELSKAGRKIDEDVFDLHKKLREFERNRESMLRQMEQLEKAHKLAAEFKALEDRWHELTFNAPWREFAFDHQIEAAEKITYYRSMILADGMGLGKTLSAIVAFDLIQAATKDANAEYPYMAEWSKEWRLNYNTGVEEEMRVLKSGVTYPCGLKILYFCPATMLHNVEREVRHWAPHRTVLILGKQPKALRTLLISGLKKTQEYVVILNYEAWRKDKSLIEDLIDIDFDTVVIDEAHNIKDRSSVGYRGIDSILTRSNTQFVIPMTGTPILNKPDELYTLLHLVDRKQFYSERNFLLDYCEQNWQTGKWYFKPGGLDRLAAKISNRYLKRTKEQAGIKLPPMTVIEHDIELDEALYPEQARARNEMRKWGSIMLDPDNIEAGAVSALAQIAVYTRLRQIETWPAGIEIKGPDGEVMIRLNIEQSQKLDEVIRYDPVEKEFTGLIPEVVEDERVVVFSQFVKPLEELKQRLDLANIKTALFTGNTSDKDREKILLDFDSKYVAENSQHEYDVVLCHYKVGGVGANFTEATQMIILDEEWNPGRRDQAYNRIHRIGQIKPTTVHVLRDTGTIDEWLAAIIKDKEGIVEGFHSAADDIALEAWRALKEGRM